VTTLTLVVGLVIADPCQPGAGMNGDPAAIDAKSIQQYAAKAHDQGVVDDAKKWSRRLAEKR
jgi:aerobic C4-dicarboxylate transport protein